MIRRYCDVCDREISARGNIVSKRVTGDGYHNKSTGGTARIQFDIHVAVNGTWNGGDLCRRCLAEAVARELPVEVVTS